MGSPCLLPEMKSESNELVLDQASLDQLRDQYCSRLQVGSDLCSTAVVLQGAAWLCFPPVGHLAQLASGPKCFASANCPGYKI